MDSGRLHLPSPLRVGFVGVGSMAEMIHLPMIARSGQCVPAALIDPFADEARLRDLSLTYNCPWYRTAEEAEIDLAFVATPISNHVDVAKPLVERGIHAFVEKPLADGLVRATDLIDSAQSRGARVFCGQVRRFYPNIVAARTLLDARMLGRIEKISLYFGGLYGWRRQFFSNARAAIDEGVLFDIGAHGIDTLLFAVGDTLSDIAITRAVIDNAEVASDIELFGTARDSADGGDVEIYAALSNTVGLANVVWFQTNKGTLSLSLNNPDSLLFFPSGGGASIRLSTPEVSGNSAFTQQLETVVRSLEDKRATVIDGRAVLPTVALLEQAHTIAAAGECSWLAP